MEEIRDQELKLFGFATNFEKFTRLLTDFEPYAQLWKSVAFFVDQKKRWTNGPVCELNSGEVESVVREQTKVSHKLLASFPATSMAMRIANKFREDVLEMSRQLAAIELVSRPGLKQRHWEQLREVLSMPPINSVRDITLNKLL